ncbi:Nn.00g051500.m01.CDS01 [Neocucurbitaria sp. VM-36]
MDPNTLTAVELLLERNYSAQKPDDGDFPESSIDAFISSLREDEDLDAGQSLQDEIEAIDNKGRFRAQPSRQTRKAMRQSRPARVLASIQSSAKELYMIAPPGKVDLSYNSPRRNSAERKGRRTSKAVLSSEDSALLPEPVSLYSILARYLAHHTAPPPAESVFQYTDWELDLLYSKGHSPDSVQKWASCMLDQRSAIAAEVFKPGLEVPPLFLLLLYLRRKHIRVFALGMIMRHIDYRKRIDPISWIDLKLLVMRLLRHARELWPESMPWIASLFATEAARLHGDEDGSKILSPQLRSDVTHFCNTFLALLSLPAHKHPVISAMHQEKAQFQVLQYMASHSPAIVVTKLGFRSVTKNQLAHAKTTQEREWAELKGPSWPPWKENRTAMDEDKGYEFGASRASKILHRMYEAGYGGHLWEEMAEIYAGWDTDYSPTIQTRTSLPRFSTQYSDMKHLRSLLWAGRVRTTRTRREAWACFLAHEMTGSDAHQEIYLAMFEKLYYPTMARTPERVSPLDTDEEFEQPTADMLPGDMKEVLADPTSPLHYVFLNEPVPTYKQLYHRMHTKGMRPSNRLLAFLLETCPDFDMALDILSTTKDGFDSGISRLVAGKHDSDSLIQAMPGYLFTAFIRFLCRFGRFHQPPTRKPSFVAPIQHASRLKLDRQYLLEYAHALLVHYKPKYRPVWTTYMDKMVQQKGSELAGNSARYHIVCELIEDMEKVDLDIDDELFRLACTATLYAVQSANQGSTSMEDTRQILSTGSSRLRTLFHSLVGANADMHSLHSTQDKPPAIPPHVPGPAELHAYVRALGILRDYEGLYSFSTWLTKHHAEVTARAEARHSGSRLLFRTLVALRIAVDEGLAAAADQGQGGLAEIAQLIKAQIESVEGWGGWPAQEYVDMYVKGHLKTSIPGLGRR